MDETVRAIETFRSWVADTPPGGLVFFGRSEEHTSELQSP